MTPVRLVPGQFAEVLDDPTGRRPWRRSPSHAAATDHLRGRAPGSLPGVEMTRMKWYHAVAYFFGGMFLTNAVPHLVMGPH